jgi:putative effector of murein hydrolase
VTVDQATALLIALTGLIGAIVGLAVQVRAYHHAVNSRMDELLNLTRASSHAAGVVEGQQSQPVERN